MVHTYSDSNNIYSVDMMLAYINIFKPKNLIQKVNIQDYTHVLNNKGWGDPTKNIYYSAIDVINNPKKYKNEYKKITEANLKYPIIINKHNIVDGVHRLSKSYLAGKKTIKAYVFDDKLLKKFLVNNKKDFDAVDNLALHEFIAFFYKQFHK